MIPVEIERERAVQRARSELAEMPPYERERALILLCKGVIERQDKERADEILRMKQQQERAITSPMLAQHPGLTDEHGQTTFYS